MLCDLVLRFLDGCGTPVKLLNKIVVEATGSCGVLGNAAICRPESERATD
jgi:hypothetical protein